MKYITILAILALIICCIYSELINSGKYKILDVPNYKTVVIDLNKNFQQDEGETIVFDELYLPDTLLDEDKFLLNYLANLEAKHLLLYKFVHYTPKTNTITVKDKDFIQTMTESHLVLNSLKAKEKEFYDKLNEIKALDYVIVNTKSKRYHKLNCESGVKSKNYKLIPRKLVTNDIIPCKSCIDIKTPPTEQQDKQINIPAHNSISEGDIQIFPLGLNEVKTPQNTCKTKACLALLKEINSAQKEILFAVFGIHNQNEIFNALTNAKNRGVNIRWVSDYSTNEIDYYPDTKELAEILTDVSYDYSENKNQANKIMHNKFFIFDESKVFTGSSNITQTDLTGFNANYAILINSKDIAEIYKKEFEQMFSGKFHNSKKKLDKSAVILDNNTKVSVYFSPKDKIITNEFLPLIKGSKSTIDISVFFLTHNKLRDELINAANRGIKIRIINDATNASNKFSIHKELRNKGIAVKTENYAGKNHSKVMIIDNKYTVIGSMNFTSSGESSNDENVLIIENEKIAKEMRSNFEKIWKQIDDKYLSKDPKAESQESIYSCYDGIDNDFDGKIDGEDEGCKFSK